MIYDIDASEWLNTDKPLDRASVRGRVVVVTVFQMLCPGCVQLSLPQARALHQAINHEDLIVIGLHSVFEHHHVMTPEALRVFAKEYRLQFPIAIDRPQKTSSLPSTMERWALQGTPSLLVFGRNGERAFQHFGHLDDLRLGVLLGRLMGDRAGGL